MNKNNLLYLIILSAFFALLGFNTNLHWNSWDTYEYINLGKSLASGKGYRQIWDPNEPLGSRLPIGYPFLLSLLLQISTNIIFLKCFSFACYIANIVLAYYLFIKNFNIPYRIAFLLSLTFSLNSNTIYYSHAISTELLFLLLLLTSYYFTIKYINNNQNINVYLFYLPISMIYAWQVKSLGLAIMLAVFIHLLIGKNFNKLSLLSLSSFLILFLLLLLYNKISGIKIPLENYGYFSSLIDQINQPQYFSQSIKNSFSNYFYIIPRSLFGFFYDTIGHYNLHTTIIFKILIFLFSLIVLIIVALGYFDLFQSRNLSCFFVATYLIALLPWPFHEERFIFPILPFILIYFYNGIKLIMQRIITIFHKINFNFLIIRIFICILIFSSAEKMYRVFVKNENIYYLYKNGQSSYPDVWKNYFDGLGWLDNNIPDHSIILTRDSSLCYLITGNKSVSVEGIGNINEVMRKISKYDVDYVITNPHYKNSNEKFLYAAIKEYSNKFSRIYGENDNSLRIFKINKYSEL